MRTLLTILLAAAISGCATAPPPLSPEVAARIKRVSVVSATADNFTRQYVGVTVFGNEREQRSISDWAADRAYEEQLGAAAEQVFSATYVKVEGAASQFVAVNDLKGPWDAPAFWGPNFSKVEASVKALCQAHALDALFIVAQRKSGDIFGGTNQVVSGAGIYTRRNIALMHLLSEVALLDCRTGKEIATRLLVKASPQPDGKTRYLPVSLPLPEELARTPIPQWTPEMEAQVRRELLALPREAWADTLRPLLGPPAPAR